MRRAEPVSLEEFLDKSGEWFSAAKALSIPVENKIDSCMGLMGASWPWTTAATIAAMGTRNEDHPFVLRMLRTIATKGDHGHMNGAELGAALWGQRNRSGQLPQAV